MENQACLVSECKMRPAILVANGGYYAEAWIWCLLDIFDGIVFLFKVYNHIFTQWPQPFNWHILTLIVNYTDHLVVQVIKPVGGIYVFLPLDGHALDLGCTLLHLRVHEVQVFLVALFPEGFVVILRNGFGWRSRLILLMVHC